MNTSTLVVLFVIGTLLVGCEALPFQTKIQDNHFRFENFKRDNGPELEYVHLMCFHHKETSWAQSKQYEQGHHNLWVKASVSRRDIPNSTKEAFVLFDVDLQSGKSYMLNRKMENNHISIWIEDADTGQKVSPVKTAMLEQPLVMDETLRKRQCESGSI